MYMTNEDRYLDVAKMIRPDQAALRVPKPDKAQKGVCRWCRGPVTKKGREKWCSSACVNEYLALHPDSIRRAAMRRDKGVCALCGRECLSLEQRLNLVLQSQDLKRTTWIRKWLCWMRVPLGRGWYYVRSLWEADHIQPLCEGGMNVMSNIRTLCLCCHRKETRALRARRRAA